MDQKDLTSHTRQLMNSRNIIMPNIKAENYSMRGSNGAMNFINYHINNAREIVKQLGIKNVINSFWATNAKFEAIL